MNKQTKFNPRKYDYDKIIKLWKKTKVVRMSYRDVAKAVGCAHGVVQRAIAEYKANEKKTVPGAKISFKRPSGIKAGLPIGTKR
jgi:phage regulator Rha-like protein